MVKVYYCKVIFFCLSLFILLCCIPSRVYQPNLKEASNSLDASIDGNNIVCYSEKHANLLETISKSPPVNRKRIFFVESSCNSYSKGDFELNPRQACAIESAAKMNPNTEVTVLFASPIRVEDPILSRNEMVQALLTYTNVHLKHVDVEEFVKGTMLEELYKGGALRNSSYPVSHASDVLRYLTLWKYGGTYLDLDVVIMKSLEGISNFVGAESTWAVAAGVVNFENRLGQEIADDCVKELKYNFQTENWGSNGPGVITRVLQSRCHTAEIYKMLEEDCNGFKVLLPSAFYPIPWREWQDYFLESKKNATFKKVSKSYAIHVWNKHSSSTPVHVGSNQPYGVIAIPIGNAPITIKRIPKPTTGMIQPLDVLCFRQYKELAREVSDLVVLISEDFCLHVRGNIIVLQSLLFSTISSPRFKEMFEEGWFKAGYIDTHPGKYLTPVQYCFPIELENCADEDCDRRHFIRCSCCTDFFFHFCFEHFFRDYHLCDNFVQ